jgi:hypothetical protein
METIAPHGESVEVRGHSESQGDQNQPIFQEELLVLAIAMDVTDVDTYAEFQ